MPDDRFRLGWAYAFLLLVLLSACVAPQPVPLITPTAVPTTIPEVLTIRFAGPSGEQASYESLIRNFEQQNPEIRVRYIDLPPHEDGRSATLSERVQAADVASVRDLRESDISAGLVRDLQPLIDADASFDAHDFYPAALPEQAGGRYLLAHSFSVPLLAYNEDALRTAGVRLPSPGWSSSDMFALVTPLGFQESPATNRYGLLDEAGFAALANNLPANIDLTAPRIDTPEAEEALRWVVSLTKSGALLVPAPAGSAEPTLREAYQRVREGRVALWPASVSALPLGDLPTPSFAIGLQPYPVDMPLFQPTLEQGYVVSAGSQHPEAAWRWIVFLSQQPPNGSAAIDIRNVPARRSLARESFIRKGFHDAVQAAIDSLLSRPLVAIAPERIVVLQALGQALIDVLYGEGTPSSALSAAQAALETRVQALREAEIQPIQSAPIEVVAPTEVVADQRTTIRFLYGGGGPMKRRWEALIAAFNREVPDIRIVPIASFDLPAPPYSIGITEQAFFAQADCVHWFPLPFDILHQLTLDLQPLLDADATLASDEYPDALLARYRDHGMLYALPYNATVRVLKYNPKLFDSAGIGYPSASWTFDDFEHAAIALTSGEGKSRQYGLVMPEVRHIVFFLNQFGAQPVRRQGETLVLAFTDPTVVQALQHYVDLMRDVTPHKQLNGFRGYPFTSEEALQIAESGQQPDDETAFDMVYAGRAAMWLDYGEGQAANYPPRSGAQAGYAEAIAPLPQTSHAFGGDDILANALYITRESQQPEACWRWIRFLTAYPAAVDTGYYPTSQSVAESEEFFSTRAPGTEMIVQNYMAALRHAQPVSGMTNMMLDPSSGEIESYWFYLAIERAVQGKNLERELADAQTMTEQYLACTATGENGPACAHQVDPAYRGMWAFVH